MRRLNDGHTMVYRGLNEEHTCVNDGKNQNSMANAKWIAKIIEEDMKMHHTSYTSRDIIKIVWHRWTVSINYWKDWHARGLALENVYGNYEASYMRVPELCEQIEQFNPGSLIIWEICPDTHKFKYLCVSFKANLKGWKRGCRPIIGLHGCFLNGKYSGVCLAAISMDANNGMFHWQFSHARKKMEKIGIRF